MGATVHYFIYDDEFDEVWRKPNDNNSGRKKGIWLMTHSKIGDSS